MGVIDFSVDYDCFLIDFEEGGIIVVFIDKVDKEFYYKKKQISSNLY